MIKNTSNQPSLFMVLALCLTATAATSGTQASPDERDQLVLEAALLHLRADTNYNLTRITNSTRTIVLHAQTPEKTGFLRASQIHADLRAQSLSEELETHLRARNTSADAAPNSYEAVAASYTNLNFSAGIQVADLSGGISLRRGGGILEVFPAACASVRAYLPGYSADGNQAVVRGMIGPTPHGATVTVLLEKTNTRWIVKRYRLARYV